MFGASDNDIGTSDQRHLNSGLALFLLSVPLGLPELWGTHLPVWEGMPISFLVILERKCLRDN